MTQDTHVDQVGGKHYQAEIQHWDVIEAHDVDYLLATATKYLTRWRKKGAPEVDLGKAGSYIEKAIKCRPGQGARRLVGVAQLEALYVANGIHWMDAEIITMLLASGSHDDLVTALARVREMTPS
jgi:hypothetical protein